MRRLHQGGFLGLLLIGSILGGCASRPKADWAEPVDATFFEEHLGFI